MYILLVISGSLTYICVCVCSIFVTLYLNSNNDSSVTNV
jgi:hypothetical protein